MKFTVVFVRRNIKSDFIYKYFKPTEQENQQAVRLYSKNQFQHVPTAFEKLRPPSIRKVPINRFNSL